MSTQASTLQLGALAASWLLFAASHSLLAGTTLERAFGRHSRLAFNAVALQLHPQASRLSAYVQELKAGLPSASAQQRATKLQITQGPDRVEAHFL